MKKVFLLLCLTCCQTTSEDYCEKQCDFDSSLGVYYLGHSACICDTLEGHKIYQGYCRVLNNDAYGCTLGKEYLDQEYCNKLPQECESK